VKIRYKLLEISACMSCWQYDAEGQACDHKGGRHIDNDAVIPDWCPLPDAKETDHD